MAEMLNDATLSLPVIRIKYSELSEIAAKQEEINQQKGSKKASIMDESVDISKETMKNDSAKKFSRLKRPDQAIYIPKAKLASMKHNQDSNELKTVTEVCVSPILDEKTTIRTSPDVNLRITDRRDESKAKDDVTEVKSEVLVADFERASLKGTLEFTNSHLVSTEDADVDPSKGYVYWNSDYERSDVKIDEKPTDLRVRVDPLKGKGRGRLWRRDSTGKECKSVSFTSVSPSIAKQSDEKFRFDDDSIDLELRKDEKDLDNDTKQRESNDEPIRFDSKSRNLDWSAQVEEQELEEAAAAAAAAAASVNIERKVVSFDRGRVTVDKSDLENKLPRSKRAEKETLSVSVKKTSPTSSKQSKKRETRPIAKRETYSKEVAPRSSVIGSSAQSRNRRRTTSLTERATFDRVTTSDRASSERATSDRSSCDRATPHLSGKGSGGIIHLPNLVVSEPTERPTPSVHEKDVGRKQLYDPERPLCIVSPGNHVLQHQSNVRAVPREVLDAPSTSRVPYIYNDLFGMESSNPFPPLPHPHFGTEYGFNTMNQSHPRDQMYFDRTQIGVPYGMGLTATEKNLREAMHLEVELNTLMDQPFRATDSTKLSQIRWKIQLRYENTILSDLEFCSKQSIEQILWKAAYYQVIECLRRQMAEETATEVKDEIRQTLVRLIEEGVVFYETLLDKLQETYGFNLNDFYDSNVLRLQTLSRIVKFALVSAQKITMCLGDLARYREQVNDGWNYGKARSWYLKAQQLVPKNGRPYNQLAILAVYARRKLDAVYYFMRSLAASNPFLTAKESLISIFDDARKKYEQTETIRNDGKVVVQSRPRRHSSGLGTNRVEIWCAPDGHVSKSGGRTNDDCDTFVLHNDGTDEDERDEEIRNLSAIQLNKKFTLSFLHVHGKLYSRVGMDSFGQICTKMLREFRLLLEIQQTPLDSQRLIQIITINMYVIHYLDNNNNDKAKVGSNCQSVIQGRAVEVGVEMFRLLVERCVHLLPFDKDGNGDFDISSVLSEELRQLLPAIKVWCDWLMCSASIWNPLPSLTDLGIGPEKRDVWTQLSVFLGLLKVVQFNSCRVIKGIHDGCEPVILPEDVTLAGFMPLITSSQETVYAVPPINKEMARNVFRIQRILFCGEFLCGMNPPVLGYSITGDYVPVVHTPMDERNDEKRLSIEKEQPEIVSDTFDEFTDDLEDSWNESYTSLRSRKQHLERVKANREKREEKQLRQTEAVLQKVSQPLNVQFEVRPHYIVSDTNCFIDHLPRIKSLVSSEKFSFVVPLIVINELDGLARGLRNSAIVDSSSKSHALQVGEEARLALIYLNEQFTARNPHVWAITAKGNLLNTITFRSEDNNDQLGTNDDIILTCCLKLVESSKGGNVKQSKSKERDDVQCTIAEVVLLTDDRNLRVKAHAHDVPVKDIPRFMTLMHMA